MSKPEELEHRVQIAGFDKQIAEMRLARALREKAQAEYQANWYEHAPLSWLLHKTFYAFDGAVTNRLTRVAKQVPSYDTGKQVAFSRQLTSNDLQTLSQSYQTSVDVRWAKPDILVTFAMRITWFAYRAVRKAAKMVAKPLLVRKRGV